MPVDAREQDKTPAKEGFTVKVILRDGNESNRMRKIIMTVQREWLHILQRGTVRLAT
jgi:hypothetical protein